MPLAQEIFKAYDIRGIVDKSLTVETVTLIGRALGSIAQEAGVNSMVIGRDGRLSGPRFAKALANGMLSLGDPFLLADPQRRVGLLTRHLVASTSSFGKPGDYRSVDDLFKYLEGGGLAELEDAGDRCEQGYAVRLTNSLLDVCEALYTGRGRLVLQRAAHAHLCFGLDLEGDVVALRFRDPMTPSGPGYSVLSLETLRRDYLWTPLKKIPRLMGPHGFLELSAEALLGHLERYDSMENLGVECTSALLYRSEDAPALHEPPAD